MKRLARTIAVTALVLAATIAYATACAWFLAKTGARV